MKVEIKIPAMGESISEATIGSILKPTGSKVKMDDELLELETEKVNQVLNAPQAGVFTLNVKTEDVVKIGQVIGYIDTEGAPVKEEKPIEQPKPVEKKVERPEPLKPVKPVPQPAGTSRQTKEAYIEDVLAPKKTPLASPTPPPPKAPVAEGRETRKRLPKIRRVIASRLLEAQHSTAMLTTFNEIDLSAVIEMRNKYKDLFQKEHCVKLGFMSFFAKAVVSALQFVPDINSYIDGDEIVHREYYDIGIAVGTDRGVMVPVVRDCDKLGYPAIEQAIEGFAKKARDGTISVEDLQGGGFTITNGGVYGSLLSTPIINPPQSGILGMHKIEKRPIVVNDQIVIRPMMYVALSYDHRIVDGKEAVSFLVHVKEYLEDPSRILLEV
jgi:2-oxoglutarate dehydrogenase E2 component (dihydrolipoamide succinyltransferase)